MLAQMRTDLANLRRRWFAGEPVDADMKAKAAECATEYNRVAREVAARNGMKPRLTTPERIMRQGEFLRR